MRVDKIRASIDAVSAMCLLERYIEDEAIGSIEALPSVYPIPDELNNFDYEVVKEYIRNLHYR